MKLNIQITKIGTKILETDKEIANIDVCNGNWKYNDYHMETEEKIPLTLNTVRKAHLLHYPVKDAYPIYDNEELLENDNLVVERAIVRPYENLLSYLSYRIDNCKEDFKKFDWWTERTFTCLMFDESRQNRQNIMADIVYDKTSLIEVKITKVE